MTKTQLRHKLKLDMHPLVGGSKSLQVRIHKGDNRFYGICLFSKQCLAKGLLFNLIFHVSDIHSLLEPQGLGIFVMNLKRERGSNSLICHRVYVVTSISFFFNKTPLLL